MDNAATVIERYRQLAQEHGAELRVSGTAALRSASNRAAFLDRVSRENGVAIRIIDGLEEARLVRAGVLFGLPRVFETRALCVDVGGGSTELTLGQGPLLHAATSIAIGGLSIHRRYLGHRHVTAQACRRARHSLARRFASPLHPFGHLGFSETLATGGTIQRLARLVAHSRNTPDEDIDGMRISHLEMKRVIRSIQKARTTEARLAIPGMDPTRADFLLGGGLVFDTIAQQLGIESWTVSLSALRAGILITPRW